MTTLTSPHDLLAAIPFLIGYHPKDSLVLVSLKGEAIGMAMRVDYPVDAEDNFSQACDALVAHLTRERSEGALLVAYVPDFRSDGESVLHELSLALDRAEISLRESLVIWQGRWRSTLCQDVLCCPATGSALPEISASRIAVEQVAKGHVMPFIDMEELSDSISSLPLSLDRGFQEQVQAAKFADDCDDLQMRQRDGAVSAIDLISRFIAGTMGRDFKRDQEISAKVIAAISDIQVRDFALGSHNEATMDIYWSTWRYLTRIAPPGFVAPLASLLAALSYEKGDGALAHRALDRALEDDPSYSLAQLLRRVFRAGWPPESFAQMRKDLHPKVCEGIFGP